MLDTRLPTAGRSELAEGPHVAKHQSLPSQFPHGCDCHDASPTKRQCDRRWLGKHDLVRGKIQMRTRVDIGIASHHVVGVATDGDESARRIRNGDIPRCDNLGERNVKHTINERIRQRGLVQKSKRKWPNPSGNGHRVSYGAIWRPKTKRERSKQVASSTDVVGGTEGVDAAAVGGGVRSYDAVVAIAVNRTHQGAGAAAIKPTVLIKGPDTSRAERGIRGWSAIGSDRVLNKRRLHGLDVASRGALEWSATSTLKGQALDEKLDV